MQYTKHLFVIAYKDTTCGYLYGSFHYQFNPSDYEHLKASLEPLIDECSDIFFECDLPHFTQLALGFERAALEICHTGGKAAQVRSLGDSHLFQTAMLGSNIWIGSSIKTVPWHSYRLLKKFPRFFKACNLITSFFAQLYNIVYNIATMGSHTVAVQQHAHKTQTLITRMFENYQRGEPVQLPDDVAASIFMHERDDIYAATIAKESLQKKNLYIVGAAHLYQSEGLVEQLRARGYTITPYSHQTEHDTYRSNTIPNI